MLKSFLKSFKRIIGTVLKEQLIPIHMSFQRFGHFSPGKQHYCENIEEVIKTLKLRVEEISLPTIMSWKNQNPNNGLTC